jgi:hypothetical protein
MGGLRDPRFVAAVSGLVACGAAATVALTAGDGRVPAAAGDPAAAGPMALPAPGPTVPVPGPTLPVPEPAAPAPAPPPVLGRPDPVHAPAPRARPAPSTPPRARDAPVARARKPAERRRRSTPAQEILDRVSAELARMEKASPGSSAALLVVPVQRDVDDDEKHGRGKKHDGRKHEHKKHDRKKHDGTKKHGHHKKHEDTKHHVEKKHDVDRCPTERVVWKKGAHPKVDWAVLVTRRHSGSGLTVRHVDASCALAALGRQHDRDDDAG